MCDRTGLSNFRTRRTVKQPPDGSFKAFFIINEMAGMPAISNFYSQITFERSNLNPFL